MKGVHIFLADGFEDMEALATRDVLLRGGIPVITVSITDDYLVESSHGLQVTADTSWADIEVMEPGTDGTDVMIFPGGMPGSRNLAQHKELMEILQDHWARGGAVAAICAAPGLVVSQLPGLTGRKFTCFDGFEESLIAAGAIYTPEGTVTSPAASPAPGGTLITGRGAGWAVDFGLAILSYLKGPEAAAKVKAGLML
ncbi:MAG: DJ-1/PfpI family protein [Bacteroidales bacterium]|nr:DJ-1/PfpI family protein [Bacteroidales bacterium]